MSRGLARLQSAFIIGLPIVWILLVLVVPMAVLLAHSFFIQSYPTFKPAFVLDSYLTVFRDPQYMQVILRTLRVAVITAASSLVVAFPLAYVLVFNVKSPSFRNLLYCLIIVPLWVSYLLRAYVWKAILGEEGILKSFLLFTGVISQPSNLFLYNEFAVILTLTYIFIPFVVMPIYASLEKIPPQLLEAAQDLGVSPARTFLTVTLPLAKPGIVAGVVLTICLTSGDFVAATLVGGASNTMVASVIQSQFGASLNWPLGAALSAVMFCFVYMLMALSERIQSRNKATKQ